MNLLGRRLLAVPFFVVSVAVVVSNTPCGPVARVFDGALLGGQVLTFLTAAALARVAYRTRNRSPTWRSDPATDDRHDHEEDGDGEADSGSSIPLVFGVGAACSFVAVVLAEGTVVAYGCLG